MTLLLPSRMRRSALCRLPLGLLILAALASITACQPAITILPPSATAGPLMAATVAPPARGLAVIGVDFDPPLEYNQIVDSGGITLLVAVENHGLRNETGIQVTAQLQDPTVRGRSADLLKETIKIGVLAPGAVEVIRFSQVTDLPVRATYRLIVKVEPVAGETDLEDNTRIYDILVDGVQ